jgi:bifunctional non-homologous end joining protein LigD
MLPKPMLAKLSPDDNAIFDDDRYLWEIKYDGNRCMALVLPDSTRIWARSGKEMTEKFPELVVQTRLPAILDGEIICRDEAGKPVFNLIQHRTSRENHIKWAMEHYPVEYRVFDVLEVDGKDVKSLPFIKRRELLEKILVPAVNVGLEFAHEDGRTLFEQMKSQRWEGVIGKNKTGVYLPGAREWLKVKVGMDEIFHIVGYTLGTGWRLDTFGALVLAKLENTEWKYVGAVGTGFDMAQIRSLYDQLTQIPGPCLWTKEPEPAKWVMPIIKCQVHFAEYTNDERLRFPSFKGIAP